MNTKKLRPPYYAGNEFADMTKHDGGLLHAVGASNYQVMRANRSHPEFADDFGNTYNHAPMLTFWRGNFYLEYLVNPVGEHTGNGQSFIVQSKDGINWDKPKICFPVIRVPVGKYECADGTVVDVAEGTCAFMHQRMGFYHTKDDRLIVSGFYGHCPFHHLRPWGNFGIGRVVREVFEDGTMGPVYFIRHLDFAGWTEENLPFPTYKNATDKSFIAACEELLADKFVTEQWTEEHGPADTTIGLKANNETPSDGTASKTSFQSASSFCWYHIDENTIAALWKHGKSGISHDGGVNWNIKYEPTFATSGAKAWGQKTEDGKFAICYVNSLASEHRYPLVAVTSDDGVEFNDMACVFGELPPRRYHGAAKDFGPQYIRGICEGHKEYPKHAMWICHSINKEDIGVSRIPLPIRRSVDEHVNDTFEHGADIYIKDWNIYTTKWSPITLEQVNGEGCMKIADKDPCDYARAMRIFPKSKAVKASLEVMLGGDYEKDLEIELANSTDIPVCRVMIGDEWLKVRYGSKVKKAFRLEPDNLWHKLEFILDCYNNEYVVVWDGQELRHGAYNLINKTHDVERLIIRTKPRRYLPNNEIYPRTPDLPGVDEPEAERVYFVKNVRTQAFSG